MSQPHDRDRAQELIVRLNGCKISAQELGYAFLADLLSAALLEAALQSLGTCDVLSNPRSRLEELIEIKLALTLGRSDVNVVKLHPRDKNKRSRHDPDHL